MCLPLACILPPRRQRVPPSQPLALCACHRLISSCSADSGCHHHGHQHCVPAMTLSVQLTTGALISATSITCTPESLCLCKSVCVLSMLYIWQIKCILLKVQILKVILHCASCHAHVMLANVIAFNHDMIWPHSLSGVHLTAQ